MPTGSYLGYSVARGPGLSAAGAQPARSAGGPAPRLRNRAGRALGPGALELCLPGLTLAPPPLSLKMSLVPPKGLKRYPKVMNLDLAASIWARAGIQPFEQHFCFL